MINNSIKFPHPPFRMRSPQRWAAPRSSLSTSTASTAAAPKATGGLVASPAPKETLELVEFGGKNDKNGGFPLRKLVDLEWKNEKTNGLSPYISPEKCRYQVFSKLNLIHPKKWSSNRNVHFDFRNMWCVFVEHMGSSDHHGSSWIIPMLFFFEFRGYFWGTSRRQTMDPWPCGHVAMWPWRDSQAAIYIFVINSS